MRGGLTLGPIEKGKRKIFKKKCSQEFQDAFVTGGGVRATCEFCGREHFASNARFDADLYDEGELERLQAGAKEDPDGYKEWGDVAVGYGYVAGTCAVWGCECGWDGRYEQFLLAHDDCIAAYFEKRALGQAREAETARRVAGGIQSSLAVTRGDEQ